MRPSVRKPSPTKLSRYGRVFQWTGSEIGGSEDFYRLYHRDLYCSGPTDFRSYGPVSRYDHHEFPFAAPAKSSTRKTAYISTSIGTAIAEVFGDASGKAEVCDQWYLARVRINAPIWLFDLTEEKVMSPGAVATIIALDREDSQTWARAIYKAHPKADGILYVGSHDYGKCVVLRERAEKHVRVETNYDRQPWDYPLMDLPIKDGILRAFDDACTARHIKLSSIESIKRNSKTTCPSCLDPARHP